MAISMRETERISVPSNKRLLLSNREYCDMSERVYMRLALASPERIPAP